MTVKVTKPEINFREKLNELEFGKLPLDKIPAGSVVQVVSFSENTTDTFSSSSYNKSSLTTTISPKFKNSKILINASVAYDQNASGRNMFFTLYRDETTNLGNATNGFGLAVNSAGRIQGSFSLSYLDSPSTTDSVEYSVYVSCSSASTYINLYGQYSTITLMEIAQ
jgi:hypothetical protein